LNGATHIDNINELIKSASTPKKKEKYIEERDKIPSNFQSTMDGLTCELDICADAFGTGVVVHIGSGEIRDKALVRIPQTIQRVLAGEKKRHILLENSAGEGNKLGSTLEDMKVIYFAISKEYQEQVSFCIDTCHLYACGEYDISSVDEVKRFFKDFDKTFGLKKLRLVHLNDSKGECGCKKDRHENIGEGYIFSTKEGQKSLEYLVKFCNKNKIDMVLETPGRHDDNIELIHRVSTV
jgi:apurinic endonuclease APN1